MRLAPVPTDPADLTYFGLRRAVGIIAIGLPFALAIPWYLRWQAAESSISGYYHTGMRNLFVGSLCGIALFMICCRGYDDWDTFADIFSGICALGVAFFPTTSDGVASQFQQTIGKIHWTCAALLFLTLACFCLFLFTMSAQGRTLTPKKILRNRVYRICGGVILLSMAMIAILKLRDIKYLYAGLGSDFLFETTALLAFGFAWLVKGRTLLTDDESAPPAQARPPGTPIS
jgi:hypothetical protein